MNEFKQQLIDAYKHKDFLNWIRNRTPEQAWVDCKRGDWLIWSLEQLGYPKTVLVGLGGQFAELALPIYEAEYPNDTRIRECIEGCKRFSNGEITEAELEKLRIEAEKAASAAFHSIAFAGYAVVFASSNFTTDYGKVYPGAADITAFAVARAFAAKALTAGYIAADVAAIDKLKQCADIVRKMFPSYPGSYQPQQ